MRARLALLTICASGCAVSDPPGVNDARPDAQTIPESDAATALDGGTDAPTDVDCTQVDFCAAAFPVSRLVALNAVWGSGPDDVWAVGTRGTILHGDGASFVPVGGGAGATSDIYVAVWGTSDSDVWILGPSYPIHSTGYRSGKADFESRPGSSWIAANAGSGRIWAGGSAGGRVFLAGEASTRFGASSSFWTLGDDGSGGSAWNAIPACTAAQPCKPAVRSLWVADAGTAWAAGDDGQVLAFDASAGRWLAQNSQTRSDLEAVWASGPSDVWAVGRRGTIRRGSKGAASWTAVAEITAADLHAVWGSGPNDVWAVGDRGTILHFDGKGWSEGTLGLPSGDAPTNLLGIWGSGPDDVWIVGEGVILHRTAASRRRP